MNWKILLFSFLVLHNFTGYAQNTYSLFYDLDVGITNNSVSLLALEEKILVSTNHSTGKGRIESSICSIDYKGNILQVDTIKDFIIGSQFPLIKTTEGFELMGTMFQTDATGARGMYQIKLDSDLSSLDRKLVYYKEYSSSNPRGQYSSGNTKVYYAGLVDKQGGGSMGYLGFFDTEQDTIKNEFVFSDSILPYNKYFINSFQETLDGNFAFMNWLWQPDADLSLRFEIMKVDSEGQQIAKIEGRAIEEQPGLIQDEEGDFYFYTEATPFFKDSTVSFPDRSGGIAKASADLDTVLWSIQLNTEVDPSSEDRWNHTSLGFSRLTDGNLITYGEARQLTTAILAGYVCKFSPEGKILWIRYFPIEVEEEYLPENSRGYKASWLRQCIELDDGRILCLGGASFSRADDIPQTEIWLLMLDEEGCLSPDDCEDFTMEPNSASTLPSQAGRIYPNPVSNILHIADVSFDRYEIIDIVGRQVQTGSFTTEVALPSEMAKGMYVLQLKEDNNLKSVFKFLKE